MPNEREVKTGLGSVCSVSGRDCRCEPDGGCAAVLAERMYKRDYQEARRWVKAAIVQLEAPRDSLSEALMRLPTERALPGPELRHKYGQLANIQTQLRVISEDLRKKLDGFKAEDS